MSSAKKTFLGGLMAYFIGLLLGTGILLGGLTDPAVIIGALDFFGGQWDPRLFLVWMGATPITAMGLRVVRDSTPIFAERSQLPCRKNLEARLVVGSVIFGAGWGMVGLCPGPMVTGLLTGVPHMTTFTVFVAVGMSLFEIADRTQLSNTMRFLASRHLFSFHTRFGRLMSVLARLEERANR